MDVLQRGLEQGNKLCYDLLYFKEVPMENLYSYEVFSVKYLFYTEQIFEVVYISRCHECICRVRNMHITQCILIERSRLMDDWLFYIEPSKKGFIAASKI